MKVRNILIGIACVMALLALVIFLLPIGIGSHPSGPRVQTMATVRAWKHALDAYSSDCGAYPTDSQGLNALLINPGVSNWHGPYYDAESIGGDKKDGWGTEIRYTWGTTGSSVVSAGPDKVFGTADDISASNQASHATSEPAPGAASSAREG